MYNKPNESNIVLMINDTMFTTYANDYAVDIFRYETYVKDNNVIRCDRYIKSITQPPNKRRKRSQAYWHAKALTYLLEEYKE